MKKTFKIWVLKHTCNWPFSRKIWNKKKKHSKKLNRKKNEMRNKARIDGVTHCNISARHIVHFPHRHLYLFNIYVVQMYISFHIYCYYMFACCPTCSNTYTHTLAMFRAYNFFFFDFFRMKNVFQGMNALFFLLFFS